MILANCEEILEMTVEEDWAEVVIASDGVWDVLPPYNMPQASATTHTTIESKAEHGVVVVMVISK